VKRAYPAAAKDSKWQCQDQLWKSQLP